MARQRGASPTKSANGTWAFIVDLGAGVDDHGIWRERRQARRRGFPTKRSAQEALDQLRVSSREGTFVAPQRQTFKTYLEEIWLPAAQRRLAESTYDSYQQIIRRHIVPTIGGMQLQAINGAALDALYTQLLTSGRLCGKQSPGLKPRTVRYIHAIIRKALQDAVKSRYVQFNAADHATPPSVKSARAPEMLTWTREEALAFVEQTARDRYGHAWAFLLLTGCRRGEALGVRWSDIDLEAGSASIRQQVQPLPKASGVGREGRIVPGTKGADSRVIELDSRTVARLRTWRKEQAAERLLLGEGYTDLGLVFPGVDGGPQQPEDFSKIFDRRVRSEGFEHIPVIRLHDLRHTWATLALEAGIDVAVVSKQLGHASPVVTWTIYQHVRKGLQSDAAERVAASIFGA